LAGCLAAWYAGCLIDELATILGATTHGPSPLGAVFDIIRAMAWLASFPLLAHTVWRLLPKRSGAVASGARPGWIWLIPGYLTLGAFIPAASNIWQSQTPSLATTARGVFVLILVHATVSFAVTGWLLVRALKTTGDKRLRQFLKWLIPAMVLTLGLLCVGPILGVKGEVSALVMSVWRLTSEASGLVLGLTFLFFVQRYNLLRLSLSNRSLRHFAVALALVVAVMLFGPAQGIHDTQTSRHLVAFGLVAAVAVALLYTPLRRAASKRSPKLRRWLGDSPTAKDLDEFSSRLHSLDLPEDELLDFAADQIGEWLVTRARLHGPPEEGDREIALLWRHFQNPINTAFNRLRPPSNRLAGVLGRIRLHAVFPLRVDGSLERILGLEVSAAGGGYQDGEIESIRLVIRQLGGVLQLRRLAEERVVEERLFAEQERLRLLGMVSASLVHEVKNPLSSIKVLAETVGEELEAAAPGSEQAEDLSLIVSQIDRLNTVAHEILGFARAPHIQRPGLGLELNELLADSLAVLRFHARTRDVQIDDTGVEEVDVVPGTSAAWQTIILNLVSNAIEYAPTQTAVIVRLARADGDLVLETENAGPAMDPDVEDRLFEDFVSTAGTGLGLGLVARRVAELAGDITVENIEDHIVFRVSIPVNASPSDTREAP
jgi:signal transduction histidine kinase